MTPFQTVQGDSPVILGLPHTGTMVPADVQTSLNPLGQTLADTDWFIHDLYDGLLPGVTTVRATFHRYVIDANRDPAGHSLYPGQNTTGLCPLTDFDGKPIYRPAMAPDDQQIASRRARFHTPYHRALLAEVTRIKSMHGFAILYDCHSIRSEIPYLFDGRLPDLNIGTNDGSTCDTAIQALVTTRCRAASEFTTVLNGRFKGGWTTRNYGRPTSGVHAIQMEIAQSAYLKAETAPWEIDPTKAARLRGLLTNILTCLSQWRPT